MITITLKLSESLLSIFRDAGTPKKETVRFKVNTGTTVLEILEGQGINPLLVPMAAVETATGSKRIDRRTALKQDAVIILHGPLAGG